MEEEFFEGVLATVVGAGVLWVLGRVGKKLNAWRVNVSGKKRAEYQAKVEWLRREGVQAFVEEGTRTVVGLLTKLVVMGLGLALFEMEVGSELLGWGDEPARFWTVVVMLGAAFVGVIEVAKAEESVRAMVEASRGRPAA